MDDQRGTVRSMWRSWRLTGFTLVCGVTVAAVQFAGGSQRLGVFEFVMFVVLAFLLSPLVFPRPLGATEAQKLSTDNGRPVVYWRPGCFYCLRLRLRLGRYARRAYWVDIWSDSEGAARVRAATGGDETVPTVVLEGQSFVNPEPGWLRHRLAAR